MMYLLLNWLLSALSLLIVCHLVSGFQVASFGTALVASLVIGLINATIGLLLKIVTFPLTIVTLGLFLFVVNAIVLMLASKLVNGFAISSFGSALLGAIVLAIVHLILRRLVLA
ncbi:MAG TPA: phage holin family protein [Candidatus Dormibacteraeota bacterium]|nr:phage holin family protein [Candidatus Dormibacteraeota bacterium]